MRSRRRTGCCGLAGFSWSRFHISSEVRHLDEWRGREVDVDFRFFEPPHIAQPTQDAGFGVAARLEELSRGGRAPPRVPAGPTPNQDQAKDE